MPKSVIDAEGPGLVARRPVYRVLLAPIAVGSLLSTAVAPFVATWLWKHGFPALSAFAYGFALGSFGAYFGYLLFEILDGRRARLFAGSCTDKAAMWVALLMFGVCGGYGVYAGANGATATFCYGAFVGQVLCGSFITPWLAQKDAPMQQPVIATTPEIHPAPAGTDRPTSASPSLLAYAAVAATGWLLWRWLRAERQSSRRR